MAALSSLSNAKLLRCSVAASVVGLAAAILGFAVDPQRAIEAYLLAFAFVVSIPLGALFVLMIGYACNAKWMSVIRRLSDGLALALIPVPVLFVPIALGLERLYPWAQPYGDLPEHTVELLKHKAPYLNAPFFVARSFVYFAIWILCALLLRRWSRRHIDAVGSAREQHDDTSRTEAPQASHGVALPPESALGRERAFSCAMLAPVSLATTFAAFDWLMSLQPTWFSTMFGVYYFAGSFLSGLAAIALLAYAGLRSGSMRGGITSNHFHALGRLLFAFVVFWAYTAYFQVFLIKIANRPIEVPFYISRLQGAWTPLTYLLGFGHFALPFALLLPRRLKYRPGYVGGVAAFILFMHFIDVAWLILPSLHPTEFAFHWLDLAMLLAVGGSTVTVYALFQRGVSPVAKHDPFFAEGIDYVSPT